MIYVIYTCIYLLLFMVLEWPEKFVFGITESGVFVFPVNNFVPSGCFGVLFINSCIFSPKLTSITTIVCSYYFTFNDL